MGQYFTNDDVKRNYHKYEVALLNEKFTFVTDSGLFSKHFLDFGTKLLLEQLAYSEIKGNVLDLGCGYGPIGIVVAKLTKSHVHLVDIKKRAIELAKKNAKLNKVDKVSIYESNLYENIDTTFEVIITNPPIRAGKKIVYEMLAQAKDYLTKNGRLWFVIRKKQGAESLIKTLSDIYKVEIIKKKKGYFVVKASK